MNDSWQILRGILVSLSGILLKAGGRIPFIFFAAGIYGANAVGQFVSFAVVLQMASAVSVFGMRRSLYELLNRSSDEEAGSILMSGLCMSALIAAMLAALIVICADWLFPSELAKSGALWLVLLVPLMAASEILLVGTRHLNILFYHNAARNVAEPWLLSILSLAFSFAAPDVTGLLLAYAGASVAAFAVSAVGFYLRVLGGGSRLAQPSLAIMSKLVRLSSPTAAVDIMENLFRRLDIFILGMFAPAAEVGIYYLMRQIAVLIQNVKQIAEPVIDPTMARLAIRSGLDRAVPQIQLVTRWIFTLQWLIVIALVVAGQSLLALLGEEFVAGYWVLLMMLLAELAAGATVPWELPIVYLRRKLNLACSAFAFVVYVALCLLLSGPLQAEGAAIAFLAAMSALGLLRLGVAKFVFHVDPAPRHYWKPLGAGLFALLTGKFMALFLDGLSPLPLFLTSIVIVLLSYGVFLYFAQIEDRDRELGAQLRERLQRRRPGLLP